MSGIGPCDLQHCADCGICEADASLAEVARHGDSFYLCQPCALDDARRISAEDTGWEMDGDD